MFPLFRSPLYKGIDKNLKPEPFSFRSDVLFTANFALAEGQQETVFYEKGVALIASATLS